MTCRRILSADEALKIDLGAPCPPELFADLVFTVISYGDDIARADDVLRTVAHHGAVLTLADGSTVVRGHPWLDAPTHEGFWWMQRPGSEPTVVNVKFFTVGETRYVHSADTQGNFGTVHVAARWQAIDTPRGEASK